MTITVWKIMTEECELVIHNVNLLKYDTDLQCFVAILEDGTTKLINKNNYYIEVL